MKRYLTDSIENMRDIGGYSADAGTIKYGKIIRSNLPNRLEPRELETLKSLGVSSVVDLRSEEEREARPSVFDNSKNFSVYHLGISIGKDIPSSSENVPISYIKMLEEKDAIYNFFNILANEDKGVLYFCNAGKDRTGVITALVLLTLGVKKEDIINDYTLTGTYMGNTLNKFGNKDTIKIITPKNEYMEKFLQYFEQQYGNIKNYLHEIGITEEKISTIKNKCIDKN